MFLVVFAVHVQSPVITSYDSRWTIYTAMSLVRHANLDLDEYADLIRRDAGYGTERVGGHIYSVYPVGPVLLAAPLVGLADLACRRLCPEDLDRVLRERPGAHGRLERLVASLVVAATATLVYRIGRLRLAGAAPALLLAGIFAFGTSAWSTASRGLWQHGPSMLMLALALALILGARDRPELIQYAALPLVGAYLMRPTNFVSVLLLSLYVLRRHRRYAARYALGGVLILVPFLALNMATYGWPLSTYYRAGIAGLERGDHVGQALVGTLVSPGRGLFVYSPVLLLAMAGAVAGLRGPRRHELHAWLVAIIVLHWLTISSFRSWWGGHAYGPRLFADVLPYLVYFLIPVTGALWSSEATGAGRRRRRGLLAGVFGLSVALSVLVHGRGALSPSGYAWNGSPVDVDRAPARLWDWRDPPFLRGVAGRPAPG